MNTHSVTRDAESCHKLAKNSTINLMDKRSIALLNKLKSLDLPVKDFAIFGSGPMVVHGLKEFDHDIDVIARGEAWKKTMTLGEVEQAPMRDHRVVLFEGKIEIFDGWAPGEWDVDELIDTAEYFDGLPYVKLEYVLEQKKRLGRVKDIKHAELIRDHIKLIESYLEKSN